jgi:hypothetical protein
MKNKRNNKRKQKTSKISNQVQRQLFDADFYVVDVRFSLSDVSDIGFDLYTQVAAATDYTNIQLSYGELRFISLQLDYKPFFQYSAVSTDYAIGAFSIRQGIFDTTVTAKTVSNVLREPGSILITNKSPFTMKQQITNSKWFPSAMTNTSVSEIPKVNFYAGWQTVCSTNTGLGQMHLRLCLQARAKID